MKGPSRDILTTLTQKFVPVAAEVAAFMDESEASKLEVAFSFNDKVATVTFQLKEKKEADAEPSDEDFEVKITP